MTSLGRTPTSTVYANDPASRKSYVVGSVTANQTTVAAVSQDAVFTTNVDTLDEFDGTTFTPKQGGAYRITYAFEVISINAATTSYEVDLLINGLKKGAQGKWTGTAGTESINHVSVSQDFILAAGDLVKLGFYSLGN